MALFRLFKNLLLGKKSAIFYNFTTRKGGKSIHNNKSTVQKKRELPKSKRERIKSKVESKESKRIANGGIWQKNRENAKHLSHLTFF